MGTLSELQLKELKNGRLAMVSMLGMYIQALTTGKGPVANWQEHIANPSTSNGFAYATKFPPLSSASQPSTGSALIMCSHLATTHGKIPSPFRALGLPQCVPFPPTTTRYPVAPQCVPFPPTTTRCRATPLHCPRSPYRPATYKGKD